MAPLRAHVPVHDRAGVMAHQRKETCMVWSEPTTAHAHALTDRRQGPSVVLVVAIVQALLLLPAAACTYGSSRRGCLEAKEQSTHPFMLC